MKLIRGKLYNLIKGKRFSLEKKQYLRNKIYIAIRDNL